MVIWKKKEWRWFDKFERVSTVSSLFNSFMKSRNVLVVSMVLAIGRRWETQKIDGGFWNDPISFFFKRSVDFRGNLNVWIKSKFRSLIIWAAFSNRRWINQKCIEVGYWWRIVKSMDDFKTSKSSFSDVGIFRTGAEDSDGWHLNNKGIWAFSIGNGFPKSGSVSIIWGNCDVTGGQTSDDSEVTVLLFVSLLSASSTSTLAFQIDGQWLDANSLLPTRK